MCVVHSIACMHTCSLSSSGSQTINTCSSLHSHMSTSVLVKDFKTLHSCSFSTLTLAFAAINSLITQWRGRRWSLSLSWSGFVTLALLHGSWLYTGCPVPFILSLNPYKELERGCDTSKPWCGSRQMWCHGNYAVWNAGYRVHSSLAS